MASTVGSMDEIARLTASGEKLVGVSDTTARRIRRQRASLLDRLDRQERKTEAKPAKAKAKAKPRAKRQRSKRVTATT